MKLITALAALWVVFGIAPSAAHAADDVYIIRMEAPFQTDSSQWLPLRMAVRVKDGKPVESFATSQQLNVTWHPVDVSELQLSQGVFTGQVKVGFRRDEFEARALADAEKKTGRPAKDAFTGFTTQVVTVNCPIGKLTEAAPGEVTWTKSPLDWRAPGPGKAKARAWREPTLEATKPQYVELYLARWAEDAKGGSYDAMYGNASLLLRAVITDGKVSGCIVLQAPERYAMQYADVLWKAPECNLRLEGEGLVGEVTLAPDRDAIAKLGPLTPMMNSGRCYAPFPAQPLRVSIKARLIGTTVAGSAQIRHEDTTVESMVLGQVRLFAYALHADRTPRSWQYTAEPDATLVDAAKKESLVPIRPGEPGKQEFWSDYVRWGGYDTFVDNGKTIVQFDNWSRRELTTLPVEEYRAMHRTRGGWAAGRYTGISAPSFNLTPVAGAVKYRFTVEVVPPPKPQPILQLGPDAAFQQRRDVPVETLVPGQAPGRWLVSDAVTPLIKEDFLATSGGAAKLRPEVGSTFKIGETAYTFKMLDAKDIDKSGQIAIPALMKTDSAVCLYTVLKCEKAQWVRLNHNQIGRGGTQSFLAGQEITGGRVIKLEPGLYPWLVIVRMWGKIDTISPTLEGVKEDEARSIEKEIAAPVPQSTRYSIELDAPWKPLTELWSKIPQGRGENEMFTMEALDAAGKVVGEPVKIPLTRYPSFQGPYHKLPRSHRDAALLSARWMRDNPASTFARVGVGAPAIRGAGGDGQLWYTNFAAMYAGLTLAQLSDDPAERADALEIAIVTGDTWLRSFMSNYLPDTYKGWAFDQWVYGTAWLDLYRLTGDERYREAVMEHARRLVAKQLPSGTWPDVEAHDGRADVDPKTGRPFMLSIQGPSMQQWDPSSALYYLGRVRKELKTNDFKPAEDKAYQWVMDNSVARMDWRKQGPGASEDHKMPWLTVPDCALFFFHYLALDLPGRAPDLDFMTDLLRWCEDRDVDWRRNTHATTIYPRTLSKSRTNKDIQLRLAAAYAALARRTGKPLHAAKAEALAAAMLVAQFPTTGQIPHEPDIDTTFRGLPGYCGPGSGDGGNRGEYATMELMTLSRLLEK